jgi:hypothetical protein
MSEWISTKVALPESGQDELYLVFDCYREYDIVYGWVVIEQMDHYTHWMRVPRPPKEST